MHMRRSDCAASLIIQVRFKEYRYFLMDSLHRLHCISYPGLLVCKRMGARKYQIYFKC